MPLRATGSYLPTNAEQEFRKDVHVCLSWFIYFPDRGFCWGRPPSHKLEVFFMFLVRSRQFLHNCTKLPKGATGSWRRSGTYAQVGVPRRNGRYSDDGSTRALLKEQWEALPSCLSWSCSDAPRGSSQQSFFVFTALFHPGRSWTMQAGLGCLWLKTAWTVQK